MMRFAAALLALLLLAAAPVRDWRATASVSPRGSVVVGNPAARVKLVEYLSFTCPHCAHFAAESLAPLHDDLVKRGVVQVETRAAMRDGFDVAAWTLARCAPASRFHALSTAIFAAQNDWLSKGADWAQANEATIKPLPFPRQLRLLADNSGLSAIGGRYGVTSAAYTACLNNRALTAQLAAMTKGAFAKIQGTPAFEINGALVADAAAWSALQPALSAAGAK